MSEYIEIETELGDSGEEMNFYTNLTLAEGEAELYESSVEMEEGSPVAQALALLEGIARLQIEGCDMTITREPDVPWHVVVADVSAALKDFFL
ncbi:MAG: NifU N-terminal domain-containing protein [Ardenticatenaceae bacterium]|nr:NifU N-terminal domain-containing protein [Ardenticatenaceae bacterium]MCB9444787.1 NifU N-terminal domain-containing protein [Ardenticatenaceae bacterium]